MLLQAGERQQSPKLTGKGAPTVQLDKIVAMVMRVFVDASPHIPEHRQLPLFTHLISTVSAARFLHTALILLLERHVVHSTDSGGDMVSSQEGGGSTPTLASPLDAYPPPPSLWPFHHPSTTPSSVTLSLSYTYSTCIVNKV